MVVAWPREETNERRLSSRRPDARYHASTDLSYSSKYVFFSLFFAQVAPHCRTLRRIVSGVAPHCLRLQRIVSGCTAFVYSSWACRSGLKYRSATGRVKLAADCHILNRFFVVFAAVARIFRRMSVYHIVGAMFQFLWFVSGCRFLFCKYLSQCTL